MLAPKKVLSKLFKVQRQFLWGSLGQKRKVHWVKWEDICLPKEEGGLGIRNVAWVNWSLMAKWRWKLLHKSDDLWLRIVRARYGDLVLKEFHEKGGQGSFQSSTWWKSVCSMGDSTSANGAWFMDAVRKRLGKGESISFWKDIWVGTSTFQDLFPRLFLISSQKGVMVNEVGEWVNGSWRWNFLWRRRLFSWEETLLQDLKVILTPIAPSHSFEDKWIWCADTSGAYSAKASYKAIMSRFSVGHNKNDVEKKVFKFLWKCQAPSKVLIFSWQVLLGRVATKDNLIKRNFSLVGGNHNCVYCQVVVESV